MRHTIWIYSIYLLLIISCKEEEENFKCNVTFKGKSYHSNEVICIGSADGLSQTVRDDWAIDIVYVEGVPNSNFIRIQTDISSPIYDGYGASIERSGNELTFNGTLNYGSNNTGNISGSCSCTKGP